MAVKKLALLIASQTGDLKGPENDVQSLIESSRGTTSKSIDASVPLQHEKVYWTAGTNCPADEGPSQQYQFLVPVDYNPTADDFRGVLDVEIAHLLRRMTKITQNVTIILDCCHSGRMARDPRYGSSAVPKFLPRVQKFNLSRFEQKLREAGRLEGDTFAEGNPHAVRIAAAGTAESAWEYENDQGLHIGAFTEALVNTIDQAASQDITWRSIMFRVHDMVTSEFPGQHPRVEGPHFDRILFDIRTKVIESVPAKIQGGEVVILAGRISGVKEDSVYNIMPAECTEANLILSSIPDGSVTAFLHKEAIYKWPIAVPKDLPTLRERIRSSKLLRLREEQDGDTYLVKFRQGEESIVGYTNNKSICISANHDDEALKMAEQFARAQHLLKISGGSGAESFKHGLEVEFRVAGAPDESVFKNDGSDAMVDGQSALVELHNTGNRTIFVSVIEINVSGKISHISGSSPLGICIEQGGNWTLGQGDRGTQNGLKLSWPGNFPRRRAIPETLVFFVTGIEVDLRDFARKRGPGSRGSMSKLQSLAFGLAFPASRDMEGEREVTVVPYDVLHVPFSFQPS
ncbi:uncharacterized protein LA080_015259 [Diaporthe eres]|nr:uncharacterized protein LA080_015259 [Diaporthe eres]